MTSCQDAPVRLEHIAVIACAVSIVMVLLVVTGAFTDWSIHGTCGMDDEATQRAEAAWRKKKQKKKRRKRVDKAPAPTPEYPDDETVVQQAQAVRPTFTSRFASRLSDNAASLWFVCIMAMLAECVASTVMPDLGTMLGIDLTGTALNLMGALIGGICSAFTLQGGSRARIASAVSGGFVAAFTSFVFFVEESARLGAASDTAGRGAAAPFYLLCCSLLGPAAFKIGREYTVRSFPPPRVPPEDATGQHRAVRAARLATVASIVLLVAHQYSVSGHAAAAELMVGCVMVAMGCIAGEVVADSSDYGLLSGYKGQNTSVNWVTCAANAIALMIATILHAATKTGWWKCNILESGVSPVVVALPFLVTKSIGSFCGALSGFGAFSEDVAQAMREQHVGDGALACWAVNIGVALAFQALLVLVFDGVLD